MQTDRKRRREKQEARGMVVLFWQEIATGAIILL